MATSVQYKGSFEDSLNYLQWKVRISIVLKAVVSPNSNPISLDLHEFKEAKVQRIILDGVKDYLIPHLSKKDTSKSMLDTLTKVYYEDCQSCKMVLRDKLHTIKMSKEKSVASYLTKIIQLRDHMAVVGDMILEIESVSIALNDFTKQWEVFVKCIVDWEYMPSWERIWEDFIQEEIWKSAQHGDQN